MPNAATEKRGFEAVIAYEAERERTRWIRKRACGFDLITSKADGSEERHIEVKATVKSKFSNRWLEPLEQSALMNDDLFYLYLVTEVETDSPKIFVYNRERLRGRFCREVTMYVYAFPAGDFLMP